MTPGLRCRQIKQTLTDNTLASMTKDHFDISQEVHTNKECGQFTLSQKFWVHWMKEMTPSDHAIDIS